MEAQSRMHSMISPPCAIQSVNERSLRSMAARGMGQKTRRKYLGEGIALEPCCNGRDLPHEGNRQFLTGDNSHRKRRANARFMEET